MHANRNLSTLGSSAGALPLLGGVTADALRSRFASASGRLRRMYDHLLWAARHPESVAVHGAQALRVVPEGLVRPMARPDERCYAFLAFLLTGKTEFARQAKRMLWALCASIPQRETHDWCQMHTWCDAFPFARYGFFFDWLATLGALTGDEQRRFHREFLYYCRMHPFERLRARLIETTPGNNQNGAMAFACVTAGYLFGCKHAQDPHALRLLEFALPYLQAFVTRFPEGGYSGEGSAYMVGVNAMLVVLGLELLRAVTGRDLFDRRAANGLATPRETLEATALQCARSGLAHPWDNYGYGLATHGFVGAYLAHRTGCDRHLRFLESVHATDRVGHTGWGFDNRLWMLLYWPQERDVPAGGAPGLSLNAVSPTLNATLEGPARSYHCLQMWDRSHWPPTRQQFNPNSLVTEFDGLPLLVDGLPWQPDDSRFSGEAFTVRRGDRGTLQNIGIGTVAAHNVLAVDGNFAFASRVPTRGTLLHHAFLGHAQYVSADVSECYAEQGPFSRFTRETLLLGDDLLLVRDRVLSDRPRRLTWLAHLRPGRTQPLPDGLRLETPEHLVMDILSSAPQPPAVAAWQHCSEVACEADSRQPLLTALPVHNRRETLADISAGWSFARAEDLEQALELAGAAAPGGTFDFRKGAWFMCVDDHRPGWGVHVRDVEITPPANRKCLLRLPNLFFDVRLCVNGAWFAERVPTEQPRLLPTWIDISSAIRAGTNRLTLISGGSLDMSLTGTVCIESVRPAPPAAALRCDAERKTFGVATAHGVDRLVWQDGPQPFTVDGWSGFAQLFAHRSNGAVTAIRARSVRGGGYTVEAEQPVDLLMRPDGLFLSGIGDGNRIVFEGPAAAFELRAGLLHSLRWNRADRSGFNLHIAVSGETPAALSVNGRFEPSPRRWEHGIRIPCKPASLELDAETLSTENLADLRLHPADTRSRAAPLLIRGIQSPDWKMQIEALESAVGVRHPALLTAVRTLLEREMKNHPTLPEREPGDRIWYRLKAAAARVLGEARDAASVPLLGRLLLGNDIYPARLACVDALAAIGTAEALGYLARVPDDDEHNVAVKSRLALQRTQRD